MAGATLYRLKDGTRCPSVTTINKIGQDSGGLINWAYQCGLDGKDINKLRDDAAAAGTVGHLLVEAAIKNTPLDKIDFPTDGAKHLGMTAFGAYQRWRESSKIRWVDSELSLVSEAYRYGGTIDGIGVEKVAVSETQSFEQYVLGDWKSGALYPDHLCQVAAYGALFEEQTGHQIARYHLCRFNKDTGDFTHFSTDNLGDAWEAFKLKRKLYTLLAGLKKRI